MEFDPKTGRRMPISKNQRIPLSVTLLTGEVKHVKEAILQVAAIKRDIANGVLLNR